MVRDDGAGRVIRRLNLTLRQRLLLLTLAALLPAVGVIAYTEINTRAARRHEVRDLALRSAQLAASEVDRVLDGTSNLLLALGRAQVVRDFETEKCNGYLAGIRSSLAGLVSLAVFDENGQYRCGYSARGEEIGFDREGHIGHALGAQGLVVGDYSRSPVTGRAVLPVARSLGDTRDGASGIIAATLDLTWLADQLRKRGVPPGGSLTIADRHGVVLSRDPLFDRFVGTQIPDPYMRLVWATDPGVEDLVSQDGTRRVLGYVPARSGPYGIYVSAGLSSEASYEALERSTRVSVMIALAGAALALFGAWAVGETAVRRPLSVMSETLARWRRGDLEARTGFRANGEIGQLGAALDSLMDEIAAQQKERRLLVQELNHRVKNALATAQAIAGSTFSVSPEARELLPEYSARLVALGRAHDLLTRENWQGAPLREVVDSVIGPLASPSQRFKVGGPDVEIGPRHALALTMLLHELCTNASKYGALSVPEGRVSILWSTEGADVVDLDWTESQGPPVVPPERRGFGTKLIQGSLRGGLGTVELDFPPEGVSCRIRLTLDIPA
jgi:two-component sensor histidine kinase